MPDAARVEDWHLCPKMEPGPVPHVGGPIVPAGDETVLIANKAAAREGDKLACMTGPPDVIKKGTGAQTVLIGNKPAARLADKTEHGGIIVSGCPTVKIGDSGQGAVLMRAGAPLVQPCDVPGADVTV